MNSTANLRRIQNEVKRISTKASEYEKLFKISMVGDDMFHWSVEIYGPVDSLYENYIFSLDMRLPANYPSSAPKVTFITPIQHININKEGDICLNILKDEWKPSQCINTVLISIIELLGSPNVDDPFNSDLAALYRTNNKKYITTIKKHCDKHCKKINLE